MRAWCDKKGEAGKEAGENGVLFGSGLIAGEGLMGIILALLAIIPVSKGVSALSAINMGGKLGNAGGLIFFAGLMALFYIFSNKKIKK